MIRSIRTLVMSMTLAAATSMTAAAMADQDSAQAALDGISASATSNGASSSDTPAPDATAHHHHHHHEEAPKAKDDAPAPAASASAAPTEAPAPQAAAAPIASAAAPVPAPSATPLQLRESHDAQHPITLAPEPASGAMWKIGAILAVLGAAAWALRKNRAPKPEATIKSLEVIRRLSIGVRTELIVVNVDGQRLLLGVTPNAIQTLASLPDPDADAIAEIGATTSSHMGDRLAALVESSRSSDTYESEPPPRASQPAPRRMAAATSKRTSRKSSAAVLGEGEVIEGQARGLVKIGNRV